MIVYAPRRVTLAPHEPQSIRIAARPPQGMPDGEYRVHLLFRAIPPPSRWLQPPRRQPKGLQLQLIPIYGVTIPVIVRLGNLQATAGIANVQLDKSDGKPAIALDLSRQARAPPSARSAFSRPGVRIRSRSRRPSRSTPRSISATSRSRSTQTYKGARRRPGDRPIFRNLRRRARTSSPKPRRCSAKERRADQERRSCSPAASGCARRRCCGALRRRRRRVCPPPASRVRWTADPDDQFLLDVNIRQLRLGDGVRAYNTPEGTCVVLGDFLTDARCADAHRSRQPRRRAAGRSRNRTAFPSTTARERVLRHQDRGDRAGTIRETPEGWCVQAEALSRWFGIGVQADDLGLGAAAPIGRQAAG